MDNLRTLCTPCHQIVTTAQAGHRARMKHAVGNQSITGENKAFVKIFQQFTGSPVHYF